MSTAASPAKAKKNCGYELPYSDWHCPFDAEPGHDLCIFHLPIEEKRLEDFWRELASYVWALVVVAKSPRFTEFTNSLPSTHWLRARGENWRVYLDHVARTLPCRFTGFVFPAMDEKHSFLGFALPAVDFSHSAFGGEANFKDATFNGEADFGSATFGGYASFMLARFKARAGFHGASFGGMVGFRRARFEVDVDFGAAEFGTRAHFWDAEFRGPVSLTKARVDGLLDFNGATLRNRLLVEGATLTDDARVLLWGLNFAHGTSDVRMDEGHREGEIVEPAGQVVFRDITSGMNQVSFLHTDILTDRLCVRFSNVKWKSDPKEFIFDAKFTFNPSTRWQQETGLPEETLTGLPSLFNVERPHRYDEGVLQCKERWARELQDCAPLVCQDVERIAREIRLSYEKYGHYGDAGDYYIAEMDFRRARLPRRAWLKRPAMWFYRQVSRYGESPGRAASVLLGILGVSALVYLFTGFAFQGDPVRRVFTFDPKRWTLPVLDYFKALLFALANVVPGYFRIQSDKLASTSGWTTAVSMIQAVFGITTLTLFLLAIRRRFRR